MLPVWPQLAAYASVPQDSVVIQKPLKAHETAIPLGDTPVYFEKPKKNKKQNKSKNNSAAYFSGRLLHVGHAPLSMLGGGSFALLV